MATAEQAGFDTPMTLNGHRIFTDPHVETERMYCFNPQLLQMHYVPGAWMDNWTSAVGFKTEGKVVFKEFEPRQRWAFQEGEDG